MIYPSSTASGHSILISTTLQICARIITNDIYRRRRRCIALPDVPKAGGMIDAIARGEVRIGRGEDEHYNGLFYANFTYMPLSEAVSLREVGRTRRVAGAVRWCGRISELPTIWVSFLPTLYALSSAIKLQCLVPDLSSYSFHPGTI